MFSGIVEIVGVVLSTLRKDGCIDYTIAPLHPFYDVAIGESIAINGVCLTVTSFTEEQFCVTAVPETLRLTNLSIISKGDLINLERSILANSRIGGHFVQGHVDGVGQVLDIKQDNSKAIIVKISIPEYLTNYIIRKGYITLDGMSITVIDTGDDWFTVTFIPHTQFSTIVQNYHTGSIVNIEVDMMGKYVEKILGAHKHASTN